MADPAQKRRRGRALIAVSLVVLSSVAIGVARQRRVHGPARDGAASTGGGETRGAPGDEPLQRLVVCEQRNRAEGCVAHIPAGEFLMGAQHTDPNAPNYDPEAQDDEGPPHKVKLHSFFIDYMEVNSNQYARCVATGGCSLSDVETDGRGLFNYGNDGRHRHPLNGVSWSGAQRYCRWVGGRLPTEAEWEYAARGTDGRRFPWGNDAPSCPKPVMSNGCGTGATQATPARRDTEAFPVSNMAGNVWEWVGDWYDPGYYARSPESDPQGPAEQVRGAGRVQRGGGWDTDDALELRSAYRAQLDPASRLADLGFRCVRPEK